MISQFLTPLTRSPLAAGTLWIMVSLHAHAETQTDAANPPVASAAAESVNSAAPQALTPRDLVATPSRNVTPEQLQAYVDTVSAVFSMRNRATDPFGLLQDPTAKPIIKPKLASTQKYEPVKATPFSDIVRLIKVTTVMPGERSFLIGNRVVNQGDRIPIAFRGKSMIIEVASVNSRQIEFRNIESGETAALSLNLMPAGMRPGADGVAAPGMLPNDSNAPIDLDAGALPMNAAQIR